MSHERGHLKIGQREDSFYSRQEAYRFLYHQLLCKIKGKVKFLIDREKKLINNIFVVSSWFCYYIKYSVKIIKKYTHWKDGPLARSIWHVYGKVSIIYLSVPNLFGFSLFNFLPHSLYKKV